MSHPPHLTSSWSSSLIPFCAYKKNFNFSNKSPALGKTNFPLCSSILPTILEGQLCYELVLNDTSSQGKKNELVLLFDYNEERSLQASSVGGIQSPSAKVQINTLRPYINFGGGIFAMSVVKRMTAKEDFLKMELKDRNCEVELYEDCRTRKLLEKCNCVPWEVSKLQVPN